MIERLSIMSQYPERKKMEEFLKEFLGRYREVVKETLLLNKDCRNNVSSFSKEGVF